MPKPGLDFRANANSTAAYVVSREAVRKAHIKTLKFIARLTNKLRGSPNQF